MEHQGHVVAVKNKTVKIILPSFGYIMMAEVEARNVELMLLPTSPNDPLLINFKFQ